MKTVTLYTDGACSGNPGPGGWAAILMFGQFKKELSGGEGDTTTNRMALTGVIEGLKALKEPCIVELYSDSKYVIDALEKGWAVANTSEACSLRASRAAALLAGPIQPARSSGTSRKSNVLKRLRITFCPGRSQLLEKLSGSRQGTRCTATPAGISATRAGSRGSGLLAPACTATTVGFQPCSGR